MEEMIYVVTDNTSKRSYPTLGYSNSSLAMIWNSQKCWFTPGTEVTITAPDGRTETFIK